MPHDTAAAEQALDDFMTAFNARDAAGVNAAFNFPHVRLASGTVKIFEARGDFTFEGFHARAETDGWHRSAWDYKNVVQAGPDKVHFDVQFTRYRADGSAIGAYKSLWIVTKLDGRWGVQARSSYAG
jgi:hypothetical protein